MPKKEIERPPFDWLPQTPLTSRCMWQGYTLEAWKDGRWLVYSPSRDTVRSYETQTTGSNLEDAQRRAQGAAMILHDLLSR